LTQNVELLAAYLLHDDCDIWVGDITRQLLGDVSLKLLGRLARGLNFARGERRNRSLYEGGGLSNEVRNFFDRPFTARRPRRGGEAYWLRVAVAQWNDRD